MTFYGDLADEQAVMKLRDEFVRDFQYRYSRYSDHYTVVAMFALETTRKALKAHTPEER